nr:immunoglobulin heavy chain junction region [Mus musculus]NSM05040.1 immunoglobulin heavy chain junction region [Mus musculus]NSM05085.1 immunoglobulin heavy chain junction region [Mus musculus]NSM05222.1 immunoglobulin heavy chain junction region [Mus musculus]NSM05569.1 immunoglobulin heavy chain junction region [Mus musculus]
CARNLYYYGSSRDYAMDYW